MSFKSVQDWVGQCYNEPSDEEKILEAANEVLEGYGVEAIHKEDAWVDGYYGDIIATYVNMGDTYENTLLLDSETEEFLWTSWGDFLEGWEAEHPEEEEVEGGLEEADFDQGPKTYGVEFTVDVGAEVGVNRQNIMVPAGVEAEHLDSVIAHLLHERWPGAVVKTIGRPYPGLQPWSPSGR